MKKILGIIIFSIFINLTLLAFPLEDSIISTVQQVEPTVVNIKVLQTIKQNFGSKDFEGTPFDDFFKQFMPDTPEEYKQWGGGSGVIIDKKGYIITNAHVVKDAEKNIKVILQNEKEYDAKLIGKDTEVDIAIIKIDVPIDIPIAKLGNSNNVKVGQFVVAIGNPFGLERTVTAGIISAKGRALGLSQFYEDFIQTDASINPGNSGGPLVNLQGEVIGINTLITTPSGGSVGIGFAIPINMVKDILDDLIQHGKPIRGYLGVHIQKLTPELAKQFKTNEGALISDVIADSPAEKAGIKQGDVIVEFDGRKIKSSDELTKIVSKTSVKKEVEIVVIRKGQKKNFKLILGERPSKEISKTMPQEVEKNLGITVQDITKELARKLNLEDTEGVIISYVEIGSPSDEVRISKGDIILEINQKKIKNKEEFIEELSKVKPGESVLLLIKSGKNIFYATPVLPNKEEK